MTAVSAWLVGLVCWSALFLMFYIVRTFWAQATAGPIVWGDSDPMRLVLSFGLLIGGIVLWGMAAVITPSIEPVGAASLLIWSGLSLIWLAEMIALSAIGRIDWAVGICALWTIYTIVVRYPL